MTGLEILEIITVVWFLISLEFFVGTENESGTNKFIYLFCFCSGFSERARTSISYIYFLQVMQRVDFMTNEFGLSFLFLQVRIQRNCIQCVLAGAYFFQVLIQETVVEQLTRREKLYIIYLAGAFFFQVLIRNTVGGVINEQIFSFRYISQTVLTIVLDGRLE